MPSVKRRTGPAWDLYNHGVRVLAEQRRKRDAWRQRRLLAQLPEAAECLSLCALYPESDAGKKRRSRDLHAIGARLTNGVWAIPRAVEAA